VHVLDLDFALTSASLKEKVASTKSKMEEENEEKKRLAEERKRSLDIELIESKEMRKNVSDGFKVLTYCATNISGVLTAMMTPPPANGHHPTMFAVPPSDPGNEELQRTKELVVVLEKRVEKMESSLDKMNVHLERLVDRLLPNK